MAKDPDESFLGRWSRLKRTRHVEEERPEVPTVEPVARPLPTEDRNAPEAVPDGDEPDLPPIESLDKDSDFSVFLGDGVPEEVRTLALRKLWRSDPVLANLDGLLEYGEDFSAPWKKGGVVATVYRVGKGMPDLLERIADAAGADAAQDPAMDDPGKKLDRLHEDRVREGPSPHAAADPETIEAGGEVTSNGGDQGAAEAGSDDRTLDRIG